MLSTTSIRGIKRLNQRIESIYLSNNNKNATASRCFTNLLVVNNNDESIKLNNTSVLSSGGINAITRTNKMNHYPLNLNYCKKSYFSTAIEPKKADEEGAVVNEPTKEGHYESGNILTSTFRSKNLSYTPGQAYYKLLKKGSNGKSIRQSEFYGLCQCISHRHPTQSKVIYNALKNFRRKSQIINTPELAKCAVENMMKGMVGSEDDPTGNKHVIGKEKVHAGLYVCNAFLEEETGLYFSLSSNDLNTLVFLPMIQGLHHSKYYKENIQFKDDTKKEEHEKHLKDIISTIRYTMKKLIRRATVKTYKSREAYLEFKTQLTLKGDLNPSQPTIHNATRICALAGDVEYAKEKFIYHFEKYLNINVSKRTKKLIDKAASASADGDKGKVVEGENNSSVDNSDDTSKEEK